MVIILVNSWTGKFASFWIKSRGKSNIQLSAPVGIVLLFTERINPAHSSDSVAMISSILANVSLFGFCFQFIRDYSIFSLWSIYSIYSFCSSWLMFSDIISSASLLYISKLVKLSLWTNHVVKD